MKLQLEYYDIYPKVLLAGAEAVIHIDPLGRQAEFEPEKEYLVRFIPMRESKGYEPDCKYEQVIVKGTQESALVFTHVFQKEQEYLVRIYSTPAPEDRWSYLAELSVYAVEQDLYLRRPYIGDLHVHSYRSDGKEAPEIVAANYRKAGYDFMAVTDHEQYVPSLEAIQAYQDAPVDLKIFPGEEVHAPGNPVHIVNFAGGFSVNEVYRENTELYYEQVDQIMNTEEIPEGVNPFHYASCLWVFRRIEEGGGLGIFCHPHWIENAYNVPDALTVHLLNTVPFGAFEVLGGQSAAENQMQLSIYHDARARGKRIPIVGSSDSHGTVDCSYFDHTKTIVFSDTFDRDSVIDSIRTGYSVAVDTYQGEQARVHGEYRLVSFAYFLLREYFPLHRELCFEEGRAMKEYVLGKEEALRLLAHLQGRCEQLLEHFFGAAEEQVDT